MYTNVYTFCSYQSAVPTVLPYPFGWRQHRFINPIHGNCILSYDSYDCEPFRSKVLSFCFHLLIVINLCLSVLCIKSDFCIYISHIETGIDFANQRDSSDCKLWLRYLRAVCVNYSGSSEDLKRNIHNLHGCIHWVRRRCKSREIPCWFCIFSLQRQSADRNRKNKTKNKKICTGNCYRLLW